MDFLDTIFSFIPLIMVILFFTRIAKSAGKKKRPKPINSIDMTADNRKTRKAKAVKPGRENPLDRAAFAKKPDRIEPAAASASVQDSARATSKKTEQRRPREESGFSRKLESEITPSQRTIKKLNSLPELKKAVIWAEILGPPKGLQ